MGLSASQARLLSITARLSDNELRTQTLTTAKMSLASKTSEASSEYLDALNETQLMFSTYDADGNKTIQKLTGTSLTQYGILKNQYGIINTDGQIMVSETDANNYLNSATMGEFLEKYGVAKVDEQEKDNPAYIDKATSIWGSDWKNWVTNGTGTLGGLIAKEPQQKDFNKIEEVPSASNEIYEAVTNSGGCLGNTIDGVSGHQNCYMHVLSDLIGPGKHTTSDGHEFTIYEGSCDEHGNTWCWNTAQHQNQADWDSIHEMIKNAHCSGDVIEGGTETVDVTYGSQNATVTAGGPASDSNMTIYQRAVDLLWEVHDEYIIGDSYGGQASPESLQKFFYFIEHDLKQMGTEIKTVPDVEAWEKAHKEWEEQVAEEIEEFNKIDPIITEQVIVYNDKDQGQWYVNLWHRMNGPSEDKVDLEGVENGVHPEHANGEDKPLDDDAKTPETGLTENGKLLWTVLEDGLMNSEKWLKYALENGYVTLERVNYTEPTEDGTGLADVTWTSIIYTNATDITEQENEAAITKAEVKYQQTVRDIEAKDKQYDNILKRLDTEHNALQTEYDSIKGVINKNIERTLKMYS